MEPHELDDLINEATKLLVVFKKTHKILFPIIKKMTGKLVTEHSSDNIKSIPLRLNRVIHFIDNEMKTIMYSYKFRMCCIINKPNYTDMDTWEEPNHDSDYEYEDEDEDERIKNKENDR